jgi:hypothetical protein
LTAEITQAGENMNNNLKPTGTKTEVTKAYRQVILRKELVDAIEDWIRNHPEAGYFSIDELASEALRLRFQELRQKYLLNISTS